MCGICGFVGDADRNVISAMTATMVHRGPDGGDVQLFPSTDGSLPAALGHRRLAIIDPTERGAQPMRYGRYWITYNGEIYNFPTLRRELETEGHTFKTTCDTEVLLAAYASYGAEMLSRLNGIFAFGIWDTERQELFLARDRLGVKPLYYTWADGVFYFASEIKALLAALPSVAVSQEAIAEYLTFLWVPDPNTMFDGIYKLPAGHRATVSSDGMRISEYWDLEFAPQQASEAVWSERVREAVQLSVRRQLISDVPVGGFLSGGLDSSAIVAEMTAAQGRASTYTIGFSAEDLAHDIVPDDLRYARQMAERFDVDYHERILHPDVVDLLPKLVWHMDEPVADPACITTYLICSAAREELTVILSGMGGDEMFAGYPRYLAARLGRLADRLPRPLVSALRAAIEPRLTLGAPGMFRGPRRNLMKLMRGIDEPPGERFMTYLSYYRPDELSRLLSPELRAATAGHDPYHRHRAYLDRVVDQHWINQFVYLDMKAFLPSLNLTYTDKMSMAASTEVRVPLLDDELVALASQLPPELKMRRLKRKYILKRSMESVLPREVIWRPKAGFGAPVRSWLVGELRPMVDELLSSSAVERRGLLDPGEVARLIRANQEGREDNAHRLWALLTLELWHHTFIDAQVAV
jgi:asparagine synthase (glutamine-hydrolysing)